MSENIMDDYKKFSISKFKEWIHDLLDGDVSVSQIYEALIEVIEEDIDYYSSKMNRAHELLSLVSKKEIAYDNSQYSEETLNAMCDAAEKQEGDKVNRWVLPVNEENGEQFINLPDDLLSSVNWKEGDTLEWIPSGNSFILQKVTQ